MPKKYDVIIIGAGIGGLTAGAILARNGKKVLVLEKNPVVGGYAVCFKRKGFTFDASLHMMQGCKRGGITYNILKQCGIVKKIKFNRSELLYRAIYPNFEIKVNQKRPNDFLCNLKNLFPKEKRGLGALIFKLKEAIASYEEFQKSQQISTKLKFYVDNTCLQIFKKFIDSPKLITILSQLWAYFGLPPAKLSGYYLPFLAYDYYFNGGYYPEGGSGNIANTLASEILANNGEVRVNNEVAKILVKDGYANKVITKKGEEFFALHIISNIDARTTFLKFIGEEHFPDYSIDNLRKMEQSISAFQIYLGLDINFKDFYSFDHTLFVNPEFNLDNLYLYCLENRVDKVPFVITNYSIVNTNVKDNQKSAVVIAFVSGFDFWGTLINTKYYKERKEQIAEILLKRAEELLPGLSSHIVVKEIATPLTMERYTGNYKGAIYGWENNIFQCGERRSFLRTPVKNLHLASAWTYPGSGISGVMYSGQRAAKYILESKSS